jgi:hypothetical protein
MPPPFSASQLRMVKPCMVKVLDETIRPGPWRAQLITVVAGSPLSERSTTLDEPTVRL